jgi:hypothetical protein
MTKDPIIDEIHKIRESIADKFNGDLHAICDDARRRSEEAARAGRRVAPVPTGNPRPQPAPARKVG